MNDDVTRVLHAIDQGDENAAEQLLPLIYDKLRRLAAQKLAHEKPGQTLNATALVHEAFLRLVGEHGFANRRHFYAAAAEAMRRILIDNARRKGRIKRGGGRLRERFDGDMVVAPVEPDELLALDAALTKLAALHPEKARLVELRFFAGLTGDQAAALMGISPSTADRNWVFARTWLLREMGPIRDDLESTNPG